MLSWESLINSQKFFYGRMVACKALPTNENIAVDLVCQDKGFLHRKRNGGWWECFCVSAENQDQEKQRPPS